MSEGLEHDPKREATSSIRGYVYQAYQSVLAWMQLTDREVLYLESAEDFDVHEADIVTTTQVKDTAASGSITLRSPGVLEAINNYWLHKQKNPDKEIRLRFLTTAIPGQEKGVSFDEARKGLEYWALASRDNRVDLTSLKDFLLELEIAEPLKDFIQSSDDEQIRNQLIRNISWDTGSKSKDALVAGIKERLVHHGQRMSVDSYHSEKALDTLLRQVVDLLCSKCNRILTLADFLKAFDESTMEFMPRGEAAALRFITNQFQSFSQAASTATAPDLGPAPCVMGEPLPLVQGAVKREQLVKGLNDILRRRGVIILRGSTGLGKTSLARLLTDEMGGMWAWAGFRGKAPPVISDQLRRAAFEIKTLRPISQIVLDDLDLGSIAQFEREFLALVFSITNRDGFVVITGPLPCQHVLLDKLWLPEECNQKVPYLNEEDILAIARNHGLGEGLQLGRWIRVLQATTGGHPQLVHARVRNFQSKNWPVDSLNSYQTEDIEKERDFVRRRLLDDIPSEGTRTLAYRLSFMAERFSRQLALDLSTLPPPVLLPGESFDILVGPWIEQMGEDKYRVSPLLQNTGGKVLSTDETQAVHKIIALSIIRQDRVTPAEIGTALLHALQANSEEALIHLASGIMRADPEALRAVGDVVAWFPAMALEPGKHLFESNPAVDFSLRLMQYRIAATSRRGENALAIMDRTLDLLTQLDHEPMANTSAALAYSVFLMSFEIPIPPCRSIDMLSRLMDLSETNAAIAEIAQNFQDKIEEGMPLAGLSSMQALFYLEAARITGLENLNELFSALEILNVDKRTKLLSVMKNEELIFADLLIGTAWWRDVELGRLEVAKAIPILRRVADLGRIWQVRELVRAAYVALSVIQDEYGHEPAEALAILDEAAAIVGENDARILNQRGKVLFRSKNDHSALELFKRAIADGNLPNVDKIFACRNAGIAAAHSGDWAVAEQFFLLGGSETKQTKDLHRMAVGMTADAAFARWKQGHSGEALSLYAKVLNSMEMIPIDQDLKNRHLHAMVRHSLAWIDIAGRSEADFDLAEPSPGACSNQEPQEGLKDLRIIDMPGIWGLLGTIDTRLGTGLGLAKLAEIRAEGKLPLLIRLHERLAKYEALWNGEDFAGVVPVIIGMIEGNNYRKHVKAIDYDIWQTCNIPPLPKEYWADPHKREYLLFNLLSVGILSTSRHPQSSLPLEHWRKDLWEAGLRGQKIDHFLNLLEGKAEGEHDEFIDQSAWALYRIRETSTSPGELFIYHFRLLNALTAGDWGHFINNAYTDLVSRQWLFATENQSFALRSPSVYVPLLREKCEGSSLHGYAKAASILETAATAAGVPVAESGKNFLSRLVAGG